jgi:hypothetical protein
MEIDGMDQSKTNLPHWPNCPKDNNKDLLMQIHVTGFGVKFLEAVMASRAAIYHTSSYKSNVELKALLQRDVGVSKMSYKFYHRGVLGNTPTVPEGIEVITTFTCISTICNTQPSSD